MMQTCYFIFQSLKLLNFFSQLSFSFNMFSFQTPVQIFINLDKQSNRNNEAIWTPIYNREEHEIKGQIRIKVEPGKTLKHQGITLQLLGSLRDKDPAFGYTFSETLLHLEAPGTLQGEKTYNFIFNDLERPVESYKGTFGEISYMIRATMKRRIIKDIILEKDINIHIATPRNPLQRIFRKQVRDSQQRLRYTYQHDKKEYDLEDCLVGKLSLPGDQPKPKNVKISFNKWECYRLISEMKDVNEHFQEIESIDLGKFITKDDEDNYIPFRFLINRYNLSPSLKFIDEGICFYVGYFMKVEVTEQNGVVWRESFHVPIQRVY